MWIIVSAHVNNGNGYASHTPQIFPFLSYHTLAATWLMFLVLISTPNTKFDIYMLFICRLVQLWRDLMPTKETNSCCYAFRGYEMAKLFMWWHHEWCQLTRQNLPSFNSSCKLYQWILGTFWSYYIYIFLACQSNLTSAHVTVINITNVPYNTINLLYNVYSMSDFLLILLTYHTFCENKGVACIELTPEFPYYKLLLFHLITC